MTDEHFRVSYHEAFVELGKLRKVIEMVEWVDTTAHDYPGDYCPWCDEDRHDGHKPDCPRQVALGLMEAEK